MLDQRFEKAAACGLVMLIAVLLASQTATAQNLYIANARVLDVGAHEPDVLRQMRLFLSRLR